MNNTISPFDTIEMINMFLKLYNKKYKTNGNLFENIDIKDPLSTNDKTELFYEYMEIHNNLQQKNNVLVDVYEPDMYIDNKNNDNIYMLITDADKRILYKSLSYISLLYIGYKNLDNTDWNIICT